ncbi:MAG: DUF1963 domain-containing protein [Moraxellaceae bacterium]|nr:DUF1963 domain-containing protein [Moraxellaceae bacterium]
MQAPHYLNEEQQQAFAQLPQALQQMVINTQHAFIKIKTQVADDIALTDSKFGGVPYVAENDNYPLTAEGNPLMLLAQINFAQVHEQVQDSVSEPLPRNGLLQIFINSRDDLYGLDFDNPYPNNDNYQVRFITDFSEKPLENIEELAEQAMADDEEFYPPLTDEFKLAFSKEYGSASSLNWTVEYLRALAELGITENDIFTDDEQEDKIYELMEILDDDGGHKIFGVPYFTQDEVRSKDSEQILLLQIDSEYVINSIDICWGDAGVANFFITPQQLQNLEFDKLMYNWDCS